MIKTVIAFDLDDTLAVTKSPISDRMGGLLVRLLNHYDLAVISGGDFSQFKKQVVDRLEATPQQLTRLHLLPTNGTKYYRYEPIAKEWQIQYANNLTAAAKNQITEVLETSAKKLNLWPSKPYGEVIEDRGSQITYSALGQKAPADEKYAWAKKNLKNKEELCRIVADRLPDLEVRLGGTTSIDVTHIGIDKAYGLRQLIDAIDISKDNILFLGDKLESDGNDYPVKEYGIDTIAVEKWEDTAFVLEGILGVTQ